MFEYEAPYIIFIGIILFAVWNQLQGRLDWNDPAAPYIIMLATMLVASSMIIGRRYGLPLGILALIWPFLLEMLNQMINRKRSLLPLIPLIIVIFLQFLLSFKLLIFV